MTAGKTVRARTGGRGSGGCTSTRERFLCSTTQTRGPALTHRHRWLAHTDTKGELTHTASAAPMVLHHHSLYPTEWPATPTARSILPRGASSHSSTLRMQTQRPSRGRRTLTRTLLGCSDARAPDRRGSFCGRLPRGAAMPLHDSNRNASSGRQREALRACLQIEHRHTSAAAECAPNVDMQWTTCNALRAPTRPARRRALAQHNATWQATCACGRRVEAAPALCVDRTPQRRAP